MVALMSLSAHRLRLWIGTLLLVALSAVACGGGSDAPADDAAAEADSDETSAPSTDAAAEGAGDSVCALLPVEQVESFLGTGPLTPVTDTEFECAYGTETDEARVLFSSATSMGDVAEYEDDIARFQTTLGEENVRVLEDVGQAAFVVNNGPGGGFFAATLGESGNTFNIYIYPLITFDDKAKPSTDISEDELYEAAEKMLEVAAPQL